MVYDGIDYNLKPYNNLQTITSYHDDGDDKTMITIQKQIHFKKSENNIHVSQNQILCNILII